MIQRRTQAILLIVFGLAVIIGVILWLLWPSFHKTTPTYTQPPAYPDTQVQPTNQPPPPVAVVKPPDPAVVNSRRVEDKLRRMAQDFTERAGSYSNADGFAGLRNAGLTATPAVREFLTQEQARLTKAYPLRDGAWGQTVNAPASHLTSPTPIGDQQEVTVQVEAQIITEDGQAAPAKTYRNAEVQFQRAGQDWVVSRFVWE